MVAFLRKVSALVVAAALILISSVPAFAVIYDFSNSFPAFTRVRFINDSQIISDYTAYYISSTSSADTIIFPHDGNLTQYSETFSSFDSSSNLGFWLHSEDVEVESSNGNYLFYDSATPASGFYSIVFSFNSDNDLTSLLASATHRLRIIYSKDSFNDDFRYVDDVTFDYSVLRPQNLSQGNKYLNTITINFYLPSVSDSEFRLNYYFYHSSFSISGIDNFSINTSFLPNVNYTDRQDGLLLTLKNGFDKVLSTLWGFHDSDDNNYTAVTDPSTSQEIQDTQDMIDDVENFEASLNQSIITEFNKIDFTTPTNLAGPVAYVGDKVTRSINALGNYQPLIFVPLTLGIMLIMLGRGVTALGSMVSSSSRAASRNKSEGDDS